MHTVKANLDTDTARRYPWGMTQTAAPAVFYGPLTESAVGIILKEAMRRAIRTIRLQMFSFEAREKETAYKTSPDFVTTADEAAQDVFERAIVECLPGYGIVGEEGLWRACTLEGTDRYVTIDPADGTGALVRRQSTGIGSMLALVVDGVVVAAYVGDVMTEEIFGFRPGSTTVHRISQYDTNEPISIDPARTLSEQVVLLVRRPSAYSALTRRMSGCEDDKALFRDLEITRGSIGIAMARLWKGEVGAVVMSPYPLTPWDFTPLLGISEKLGCCFLAGDPETGRFGPIELGPSDQTQHLNRELLVIHRSRLAELEAWQGEALGAVGHG